MSCLLGSVLNQCEYTSCTHTGTHADTHSNIQASKHTHTVHTHTHAHTRTHARTLPLTMLTHSPVLHLTPVHPVSQVHVNPPASEVHVPSLRHGSLRQPSIAEIKFMCLIIFLFKISQIQFSGKYLDG